MTTIGLHAVVAGLTLTRAAALGRAPIPEDIEVALLLLGYGDPRFRGCRGATGALAAGIAP